MPEQHPAVIVSPQTFRRQRWPFGRGGYNKRVATAKEEIRRFIDTLPDDATWEDVQYSIYVRERIERGRRETAEGQVLDHDEVERRMQKWLGE